MRGAGTLPIERKQWGVQSENAQMTALPFCSRGESNTTATVKSPPVQCWISTFHQQLMIGLMGTVCHRSRCCLNVQSYATQGSIHPSNEIMHDPAITSFDKIKGRVIGLGDRLPSAGKRTVNWPTNDG